jgi:hypothetical protein
MISDEDAGPGSERSARATIRRNERRVVSNRERFSGQVEINTQFNPHVTGLQGAC